MLQERKLWEGQDNVAAEIGEAATLTVDLSPADEHRTDLRYRYLPLKNVQERQVSEELKVDKVGYFGLELVDNTTQQSCKLLSRLRLSCGEGFELGNENKCERKSNTNLQKIMGIGIGVVLALLVGLLLALVRKNPKRAKKLFVSFLGTWLSIDHSLVNFQMHFWQGQRPGLHSRFSWR